MQNAEKSLLCLGSLLLAVVCFSDTARAQNGTLAANPPQLTFSAPAGTTPPSQTLTITSTAGPTHITVATISNNNWLTVTTTNGTTPLQLTVSVNPAVSNLTTDDGFINIAGGGASLSVRVELDTAQGPGPIAANPNSLSFTFDANSGVPATQSLALSSSSPSVTTFTATPRTSDGGAWLTVSAPSGTFIGGLQVTVNPTALPATPGPFSGAIALNAPGTSGISVPVLVTLAGTPAIVVNPTPPLNFAWQIGTNAPAAQTLSITSSTGANVSFTATAKTTSCGNWLVISPANGATPSSITAQVNTSGLNTAQLCAGEIDIAAPTASNPAVVIVVNLLVSTNPLLLVPSTGPDFTYQIGTSTQLAVQNVQITSSSNALNFTATVAPTTAGGPNFLTVNPATSTTPQALALSVNPAVLTTLGPGVYSETVTLTSAGAGNSPQTFTTTLTVNSNPILLPSVQSLTFNFQVGHTPPTNQTFTVASTGSPLNFQVTTDTSNCPGFLSATAFNGANGLTYQNQVIASVHVGSLNPQVCSGHITLTVPNSNSPAQVIPVTLNISNNALLNVSTNVINVTALAVGLSSMPTVSVTSTDPATVLPFTASAATNPIGLTWLSVTPNTGNTPNNLLVTINPQNLGVGTYPGTITVSSPNLPVQTIHVTLTIVSSNVSASLAQLAFAQTLGGTPPAAQAVTISGVPGGTTIGALPTLFNGVGWLQTSVNGNVVTVTADGSSLSQGTFSGLVTVIVPGAGNSPLYIPVTLTVSAVNANTLILSATTVPFTFQAGGVVPTSQTVQVTSTTPGVPITATFNPGTGGNFVTVTPASGTTPVTLTLAIDGSVLNALAKGTYTGNVVVSSASLPGGDQTIKVTLTVAEANGPAINAIANAASFLHGPISPGELVTIFGTNIGPATGILFTPDNGHVDTTLGDTVVMFNNFAAPLIYVSATQINAIVPYEVPVNSSIEVTVKHANAVSASFLIASADTAPGLFSANQSGNGQGAILNSNLGANSANNPAPLGSVVSLFATGEGLLTPQPATGSMSGPSLPLPVPLSHVSVTIGGETADVSYAGEAPTLVSGVLQINAKIPTNIKSGNKLVVVTIGNSNTKLQSVTVAVQ